MASFRTGFKIFGEISLKQGLGRIRSFSEDKKPAQWMPEDQWAVRQPGSTCSDPCEKKKKPKPSKSWLSLCKDPDPIKEPECDIRHNNCPPPAVKENSPWFSLGKLIPKKKPLEKPPPIQSCCEERRRRVESEEDEEVCEYTPCVSTPEQVCIPKEGCPAPVVTLSCPLPKELSLMLFCECGKDNSTKIPPKCQSDRLPYDEFRPQKVWKPVPFSLPLKCQSSMSFPRCSSSSIAFSEFKQVNVPRPLYTRYKSVELCDANMLLNMIEVQCPEDQNCCVDCQATLPPPPPPVPLCTETPKKEKQTCPEKRVIEAACCKPVKIKRASKCSFTPKPTKLIEKRVYKDCFGNKKCDLPFRPPPQKKEEDDDDDIPEKTCLPKSLTTEKDGVTGSNKETQVFEGITPPCKPPSWMFALCKPGSKNCPLVPCSKDCAYDPPDICEMPDEPSEIISPSKDKVDATKKPDAKKASELEKEPKAKKASDVKKESDLKKVLDGKKESDLKKVLDGKKESDLKKVLDGKKESDLKKALGYEKEPDAKKTSDIKKESDAKKEPDGEKESNLMKASDTKKESNTKKEPDGKKESNLMKASDNTKESDAKKEPGGKKESDGTKETPCENDSNGTKEPGAKKEPDGKKETDVKKEDDCKKESDGKKEDDCKKGSDVKKEDDCKKESDGKKEDDCKKESDGKKEDDCKKESDGKKEDDCKKESDGKKEDDCKKESDGKKDDGKKESDTNKENDCKKDNQAEKQNSSGKGDQSNNCPKECSAAEKDSKKLTSSSSTPKTAQLTPPDCDKFKSRFVLMPEKYNIKFMRQDERDQMKNNPEAATFEKFIETKAVVQKCPNPDNPIKENILYDLQKLCPEPPLDPSKMNFQPRKPPKPACPQPPRFYHSISTLTPSAAINLSSSELWKIPVRTECGDSSGKCKAKDLNPKPPPCPDPAPGPECAEIALPCCSRARVPPDCNAKRPLPPCKKKLAPKPSFSECSKDPPPCPKCTECKCWDKKSARKD